MSRIGKKHRIRKGVSITVDGDVIKVNRPKRKPLHAKKTAI